MKQNEINEMVSVVIPVYNRETTIKRAMESVLSQSYKNIELIVVDDCSTDGTARVINSVHDSRVQYYRLEKNSGACAARNHGVEKAKGKFVAFQDSDDEWHHEKIDLQINYLKQTGYDICFCSFMDIDLNGERKKVPSECIQSSDIRRKLLENNFISTQTLIGKRECFMKERFDERFPRYQDWDLAIRLSKRYSIGHLDKVLVDMYKQKDSMTFDSKKTAEGLGLIIMKFGKEMKKQELSKHYAKMAKNLLMSGQDATEALKCSWQNQFSLKVWFGYILSKCGLLRLYYKMKMRSNNV